MSNRTLQTFAIIVGAVVGLLFLINLRQFFFDAKPEGFLAQDNVNGIAILHKKKLYTLNFDQQKELVHLLNLSLPVMGIKPDQAKEAPDFDEIVIYLFKGDRIVVTPLAWVEQSLVFSARPWQSNGYLKDMSGGKLYDLLKTTYDP